MRSCDELFLRVLVVYVLEDLEKTEFAGLASSP